MRRPKIREGTAYLVMKPHKYGELALRLTKRPPSLAADEVAVRVEIRVPDLMFNRPALEARIELPDQPAQTRVDLEAAVKQVQAATGLQLVILEPEEASDDEV